MIVSSQISFLQGSSRQETAFDQSQLRINQQPLSGPQAQGSMSVEANRYMFYSESETRSFASTGSISLESGETIDFTLSLRRA